MPTVSFEGETHDEIVRKVRRWLASIDGQKGSSLSAVEAVEHASEITKDALAVIAAAAPGPVAGNVLFRELTRRGYKATDTTKRAVTAGLDALSEVTGGRLGEAGRGCSESRCLRDERGCRQASPEI